ncbi:hypothetical protein chiPu_0023053 [Chiloscyllium punctatum]|uniref:Uncharacterized protein n=1 Tax=Chiloscyllium punctatum TaxID=137246 RepID=A0A401T9M0_CHIPU|nr:hypothetical protein [Chiloscyllium punctatum]
MFYFASLKATCSDQVPEWGLFQSKFVPCRAILSVLMFGVIFCRALALDVQAAYQTDPQPPTQIASSVESIPPIVSEPVAGSLPSELCIGSKADEGTRCHDAVLETEICFVSTVLG